MVTERDVQAARAQGQRAGYEEAVRDLRAFPGISYNAQGGIRSLVPDLSVPEHVAYAQYRLDLRDLEHELAEESAELEQSVEKLRRDHFSVEDELNSLVKERQAERAGRLAVVRAGGWVKDQLHPLRAKMRQMEQLTTKKQDYWWAVASDHQGVQAELANVNRWLSSAANTVTEQEAEWQRRLDVERRDADASYRDISPRWCGVTTPAAFIAEDERRASRSWSNRLAGIDFGYKWRRDGDDDTYGDGSWSLYWNEDNHEAFFELNVTNTPAVWLLGTSLNSMDDAVDFFRPLEPRMSERNSVAIVLDAWSARFGPDQW